MQAPVKRLLMAFTAGGTMLLLSSCSSFHRSREQNAQPDASGLKPPRARSLPPSSSPTVAQLEKKLRHAKSSQITLSRKLLLDLIDEEKLAEARLSRLSSQLEALKKVDREEAQKLVQ